MDGAPELVHDVLRSSGQPLDPQTRAFMEPRFGHSFSQVRVHTDARAAESARTVDAAAYTVGHNVVFDAGQYAPATVEGRKLLAHELIHVMQQGAGTALVPDNLSISAPGDADEREADKIADSLSPGAGPAPATAAPLPSAATNQQNGPGPQSLQRLIPPRVSRSKVRLARKECVKANSLPERILNQIIKPRPNTALADRDECLREFFDSANEKEATTLDYRLRPGSKDTIAVVFRKIEPGTQKELIGVIKKKLGKPVSEAKPEVDVITGASKGRLPEVDIISGVGPPAKKEEEEAKPITEAAAYASLDKLLRGEVDTIETNLKAIGNRSLMFTADLEYQPKIIALMRKTLDEGKQFAQDSKTYEQASARYEAVLIIAQVEYFNVAFLSVADAAENAGQPWPTIEHALKTHKVETTPLLNSVVGFDREKMKAAATASAGKLQEAKTYLETWVKALKLGTEWSGKAIAAADAVMIVYSLYQIGGAFKGGGGKPPTSLSVPSFGAVTSGGAAAGVLIQIPAEVIEGIRKLIQIGALNVPILALGTGPNVTLPVVPAPLESSSQMSGKGGETKTPKAGKPETAEPAQGKGSAPKAAARQPGDVLRKEPTLTNSGWGPRPPGSGNIPAAEKYADKVTGSKESIYVSDLWAEFDGYRAKDGFLLDAKFTKRGGMYDTDVKFKVFKLMQEAERQVDAASRGGAKGVEWIISDKTVAEGIEALFKLQKINIRVVFVAP